MLDICLLGCGGSMPMPGRYLTSLIVGYKGRKILIDCGEGTQVSMKIAGTGFKAIDAICFTHYHADHVAGLPGLLLTIANSGRTEPLTLVGPVGLEAVIRGLLVIAPILTYDLNLIEISEDKLEFNIADMTIKTLQVEHAIPCLAYSVEIKRGRRFDTDKAKENEVPVKLWGRLQKGESVREGGKEYTPEMVLAEERSGLRLCYSTDTRPISNLKNFIKNAELFICEGMYGDNEDLPKAIENKHMLFKEAATLAKEAKVKELWLTHFSPSLTEPEKYLDNAKEIFENTRLGADRISTTLKF